MRVEVRKETGLAVEPGRLLAEIARDPAGGWHDHPRWLGNLWDSSL